MTTSVLVAYHFFNENNINFIPLVNDFNNFPNNLMFMKNRQRFDVVLCLAFVHHLVFSNGFTFERICDVLYDVTENNLIIEFIQITDPHIMLWYNKYFTWYNEENFREIFSDKFDIIESENVSETRKLFFMQKK